MKLGKSVAIQSKNVEVGQIGGYFGAFAERVAGRERRALGEVFNLKNFGVNYTRLSPGSESSLLHRHDSQDEFVFILEGNPTLETDGAEIELSPGMCAGFPANGEAHHLINKTNKDVILLEIGDRTANDLVNYPADDMKLAFDEEGKRRYVHLDGTPY